VGGAEQKLSVLEKGDFFGEMSVLENLPRTASARAVTEVKLLQINGATFSVMLKDNPEIAVRMMRKLSRRLRDTDAMLREALAAAGETPRSSPDMPSPDRTSNQEVGPERLVHEKSGMEFYLARGSETTMGRKDPVTGIYPDIDVTPVDSQRSISRRHAKIYRRGDKFFLAEEIGTMNGTYASGQRLETGVPAEIQSGDEVRLGMVVMVFQAG
jgi:pSer/pThr/pTyr-binding forkhead associated (FHA) protein